MKSYFVYILAKKKYGTMYIGVTSDLEKRIYEHKKGRVDGLTKKYGIHLLVYFQETQDVESAILHEKKLKRWKRQWKYDLIEKDNPDWDDLSLEWIDCTDPASSAG